jgi:hypothetical protein
MVSLRIFTAGANGPANRLKADTIREGRNLGKVIRLRHLIHIPTTTETLPPLIMTPEDRLRLESMISIHRDNNLLRAI